MASLQEVQSGIRTATGELIYLQDQQNIYIPVMKINTNEHACGGLYLYEEASNVALQCQEIFVARDDVSGRRTLLEELQDKFPSGVFSLEDVFLCQTAKQLGYDVVILTHMEYFSRPFSYVFDVRSRQESWANLAIIRLD